MPGAQGALHSASCWALGSAMMRAAAGAAAVLPPAQACAVPCRCLPPPPPLPPRSLLAVLGHSHCAPPLHPCCFYLFFWLQAGS